MEVAMNAIVANVLKREAVAAQADRPFSVVALFCAVGLLASVCIMSLGFDVGAGLF
jgi:hypothetical protein